MPTSLRYRCVLCPNTDDAETDRRSATVLATLQDACTHLVDYHRIDPALLQHVTDGAPISIRIGSLRQATKPWKLPKYGAVIETYHQDEPGTISDNDPLLP
jgi:hypothetical protein